jgi:hypothetical protein
MPTSTASGANTTNTAPTSAKSMFITRLLVFVLLV